MTYSTYVVIGTILVVYLAWVTINWHKEHKQRTRYLRMLQSGLEVCALMFCREPESSSVHVTPTLGNSGPEGTHIYRPGILVTIDQVPIRAATRDQEKIFAGWKIK